jgi:hypothetical protein
MADGDPLLAGGLLASRCETGGFAIRAGIEYLGSHGVTMKLAKDDLIAALRLRYDYYSAQTVFDVARERAGLADQPSYELPHVVAFRGALAAVGDRVDKVQARIDALLEGAGVAPAAAAAPAPAAPEAPAVASSGKAETKVEAKAEPEAKAEAKAEPEAKAEAKAESKVEAKEADKPAASGGNGGGKGKAKRDGKSGD